MAKQFNEVAVGEKFVAENKVWVRVKTVKKGPCCGNKNGVHYNSRLVSDSKKTRLFKNGAVVENEDGV